jgi:stage V sporulation protein G
MNITEVNIKISEGEDEHLMGFASIAIDNEFVIRDLKIIRQGNRYFVAMPSRKLTDRCPRCETKTFLKSRFCHQCGVQLGKNREFKTRDGGLKFHADIAHPITSASRLKIERAVLTAYLRELEIAKQPGYICTYDEPRGVTYSQSA